MKKDYKAITERKIKWLEEKGLIVIINNSNGDPSYIITAKGLEYLNG